MTEIEKAVYTFNDLSASMGYEVSPPWSGKIKPYNFGRDIAPEQPDFWCQYEALLRISNGLFADGHTFYGISVDGEPGLIEYNDALNTPDLETKAMQGRIVVGENNTDILYYDTLTGRWESCDHIGTDNVWKSCDSLTQLVQTQVDMLTEV
ncbi:hypothetical protein HQN64_22765 [Enterobacteriaceae bacterium BIT-l23]|uniref:YrhA family protein n=1 Tax=Jejubacter sp. L23 TaxID=3092086 RepID=UPI001584F8EA|nr:hypothetical protein [Enterobacteriaceae bacterium BIT-l23]